jgi:hypothetical protein
MTRRPGQTLGLGVFLIWDLVNFNLFPILSIPFNCTHNCLSTFNYMQLHPFQIQISTLEFSAFYRRVIGFQFVQFHS